MAFKSAASYYGGKSRIIDRYPPPRYPTIIEPFAGMAAYVMRWAGGNVNDEGDYAEPLCWVNDLDPKTYAIWEWLTSPRALEIARHFIPHSVVAGQKVSEIAAQAGEFPEADGFLAFLQSEANQGTQGAKGVHDQVTRFGEITWPRLHRKVEWVIPHVKDFKVTNLDYRDLPDLEATWFIDPPYNNEAGKRYRTNKVDYNELATWCKSRKGQVIVCENAGADWLDFQPLVERRGIKSRYQQSKALEVIWTNDT
jgi:site-specific DNA-adenine methylase